ncbi:MAG: nucleoside hydrolase-like domain-containing protein [Parafilimonas sp.]
MSKLSFIFCTCIFSICLHAQNNSKSVSTNAQTFENNIRPRIVITADPELDDNNSLIRFLLYSSDVDVEGLIYASSGFHWKGDGKGTKWYVPGREYARFGLDTCPCTSWRWAKDERFIDNAVEAYAKVYTNLKMHNPNYPSPEVLKSKIRFGNVEFDGDISKDSPGSDLIKSLMLDDKPGKLFITAWGGQSTIARALKSIQEQYEYTTEWEAIKNKVSRKVVLLPSGDQDDMYAKYIKPNWPDIEYRQFFGGPNYGYGAQLRAKPEDSIYLTSSWMKENISDRGALGALYRVWGDGKQMVKGDIMDYFGFSGYTNEQLRSMGYAVWMPVQPKGSWLGEGDDFTFMNIPGNGLRAYEDGSYGGWGGRQMDHHEVNPFSQSTTDTSQQTMVNTLSSTTERLNKMASTYPDFFPAAQNDFAARLKWSVIPKYSDANHAPVVTIEEPLNVLASPGQTIRLNGKVSDPDGNNVSIKWWQFMVGTYPNKIGISNANTASAKVAIPKDAIAGQTIHIILEVTDNGSPSLTKYQRVIITIK